MNYLHSEAAFLLKLTDIDLTAANYLCQNKEHIFRLQITIQSYSSLLGELRSKREAESLANHGLYIFETKLFTTK